MAYEAGELEATLAAAAGDDTALLIELRQSYLESVERQIDLLTRSRCDGNWTMAAMRLSGLAASFHARDLRVLAEEALSAAPGDPVVIRRLKSYTASFSIG